MGYHPHSLRETWEDLFNHMRTLLINLEIQGPTHFMWVETENLDLLAVNSPDKNILPFLGLHEKPPVEAIFDDVGHTNKEFFNRRNILLIA